MGYTDAYYLAGTALTWAITFMVVVGTFCIVGISAALIKRILEESQ